MSGIPSFHSLHSTDENNLQSYQQSLEPPKDSPRTAYSKLRNEREQATFNLMMRMDPSALANIRQEFYGRDDEVCLNDFIYIMYKHLIELAEPDSVLSQKQQDTRSFVSDMNELFKEVDVNGDGMMEWEEFTKFTVEKASLLNQKFVMATIPEYVESTTSLDISIKSFRRNDICRMLPMPSIGCFSVLEEHSKEISIYYSLNGRHVTNISTESVPLAIDFAKETSTLFASCSNLQINMYQQLPNKRFQFQGTLPTHDTQMSLAWMPTNEILYSGSESGVINCWKPSEKTLLSSMTTGHSDICMKLLSLDQLDNLVSASMDTTIGVWDTYTNNIITKLSGHKKGVFDMSYNPDYRLLFSCGFDHDAFVWSPFVNSLVFKLKGHHASLVGCHSVENSPEVLTADEDGVFKLWDIRTFQCVQTFFHNSSVDVNEPAEHLSCFFHQNIPTSHRGNEGGEARIYAGSRRIRSFDQKRIVHQRTTDFTNVIWMSINSENFLIFTASDRNVIIWDLLLGSKMLLHNNICGEDISACCVDDRQRKIIIGDIRGHINVYNPLTGAFMKSCPNDIDSVVTSLIYLGDNRRFIAGYACAIIRIYDESKLDDCFTIRTFEINLFQNELTLMSYCPLDRSIVTAGSIGQSLKVWDYDTGKLDMEIDICPTTETVVAITVLEPFPLILTSDSTGSIAVWGSRGCKWKGNQITSFLNINPYEAVMEEQKKPDANGIPPQRIFPLDDLIPLDPLSPMNAPNRIDERYDIHSNSSSYFPTDDELKRCEKKWGRISAATTVSWDREKYELYTGDELGYLRKWSLADIIDELGGMAMVHGHKSVQKESRITKRIPRSAHAVTSPHLLPPGSRATHIGMDSLPHATQVSLLLGSQKYSPLNVSESAVKFCWALQGHNETIISCVVSANGILTSSTDSLVKMWTFEGLLTGVLLHNVMNGVRSMNWNIQIDLENVRAKEENELNHLMHELTTMLKEREEGKLEEDRLSEIDTAVAEAKFSRSTLRKRIELSSKILGLDFTTDLEQIQRQSQPASTPSHQQGYENVVVDEAENDNISISSASINTMNTSVTTTSKSTRDAIDESKNIFRHTDLLTMKRKPPSVAQLRRSEQTMQKMAEKYLEKGIKLPILKSSPKSPDFLVNLIHSTSSSSLSTPNTRSSKKKGSVSSLSMTSVSTTSTEGQSHCRGGMRGKQGISDEVIQHQSLIAKKCSKYSSFENLEQSLNSPPVSFSSLSPPLSPTPTSSQIATDKLYQRQLKMINKMKSEQEKLKNILLSENEKEAMEAAASARKNSSLATPGVDGTNGQDTSRKQSKFNFESGLSRSESNVSTS